MLEKWKIYQPFKNWKKAVVGVVVVFFLQCIFAQSDYGLELDFKDGLPSSNARKTHIDPEGTVWVGTDAGVAVFPNFNQKKVSITKKIGYSQVWDIHQDKNLIYFATYDSGLFIFNYQTGHLVKKYKYSEIPRIRKFKTIGHETYIVANTSIYKVAGKAIQKILGRHPFPRDSNSMCMDIFKWKNNIHVSYFKDEKLVKFEQNKWVVCDDELGKYLISSPTKIKTIMSSHVYENKLICSTGDSKFFTLDENNNFKKYNFTDKLGSNYVIWDIKQSENHIYFAVGNTENFEKGMLFEFKENETLKEVPMHETHHFLWSITNDPWNRGIWASTIKHGVYFLPNYNNRVRLPKNLDEFSESKNYDFAWSNESLYFKLKTQSQWNSLKHNDNIRNVLEYEGQIVIESDDGIYLMKDTKTKKLAQIFSNTFEKAFIQNNILYAVNYFGPIWSYSFKENKVINHLPQTIKNFNSTISTELYAILHNDNQGYYILINDSLHPLPIELPISRNNYSFYVSGRLLFLQTGNELICCEINEINHSIKPKCKLNLKDLFPFFKIEWIKGSTQGLWLGNTQFALQVSVNPYDDRLKIQRQFYLGGAKNIQNIYISKDNISIIRGLFIQKIPINSTLTNTIPFNIKYKTKSEQPHYSFPLINQGQNFNLTIETPDYLQSRYYVHELNLSSVNHYIYQKFYTNEIGIWLNDLPRNLFQIKLNCQNQTVIFPLLVNNSIVKRTEFWIYIFASICILFFILYNQQRESYLMQQKILSLELSTIKSNMNPHFVFNLMNFVQAMIVKSDKKKALKATSDLAHLNRLFLETSNKEIINLKQEINLARKYINLEKMRFEQDKTFDFSVSIEKNLVPENWFLPPLLLQPLLENAVKHGVLLLDKPGKIKIIILQIAPNEIDIIIQNIGKEENVKRIGGTGLGQKLVIDRIQLFNRKFANDYFATFSANFDGNLYNCHLTIKNKKFNS